MSRALRIALIASLVGPSASSDASKSLISLSERMRWDHYGTDHPPANSGESTSRRRRRRRRLSTNQLTVNNTLPIRLTIDYASLYEETAPQYSACFRVGDWYARGLPGQTLPSDGLPTCSDDVAYDCWGICAAADLITPTGRQQIIDIVDAVVMEVQAMIALVPMEEALVFDDSVGRYASALAAKGYPPEEACARDCTVLNGVAVAESYCTTGVQADAVFSITKAPTIPGIAGSGGACASDSTGRPTWLVFTWIQDATNMRGSTEELIDQNRALVIHELLHALGARGALRPPSSLSPSDSRLTSMPVRAHPTS